MALAKYAELKWMTTGSVVDIGLVTQAEFDALPEIVRRSMHPQNFANAGVYDLHPELREGFWGPMMELDPLAKRYVGARASFVEQFRDEQTSLGIRPPVIPPSGINFSKVLSMLCASEFLRIFKAGEIEIRDSPNASQGFIWRGPSHPGASLA